VNARRSHSADRILDVIQNYKLSPVPFIPYASTLSLSVAYRKWRFSQLPMFRTRGGADFKSALAVVQELGGIWSTARINGQLGQAVVRKLDQTEVSRKRAKRFVAKARTRRRETGVTRNDQEDSAPTLGAMEGSSATKANEVTTSTTQTTGAVLPQDAPPGPQRSQESAQAPAEPASNKHPANPPQQNSVASSTTETMADRLPPQTVPPAWTSVWPVNGSKTNTNTNNAHHTPSALPWTAPQPVPPTTPYPTAYAQATASTNPGHQYTQFDDPIPLPGELLNQSAASFEETSPMVSSSNDGSMEDFLLDDDALFRSWDPRFTQSVDFSFSSILDPGNPFAWPEYCEYMS